MRIRPAKIERVYSGASCHAPSPLCRTPCRPHAACFHGDLALVRGDLLVSVPIVTVKTRRTQRAARRFGWSRRSRPHRWFPDGRGPASSSVVRRCITTDRWSAPESRVDPQRIGRSASGRLSSSSDRKPAAPILLPTGGKLAETHCVFLRVFYGPTLAAEAALSSV